MGGSPSVPSVGSALHSSHGHVVTFSARGHKWLKVGNPAHRWDAWPLEACFAASCVAWHCRSSCTGVQSSEYDFKGISHAAHYFAVQFGGGGKLVAGLKRVEPSLNPLQHLVLMVIFEKKKKNENKKILPLPHRVYNKKRHDVKHGKVPLETLPKGL